VIHFIENLQCEIWLLDLSLQWHYLAGDFTQYYRMMISHLGIRGWQYLYTEYGLTPQVKVHNILIFLSGKE